MSSGACWGPFTTSNWPFASALSIILVVIALFVIVGYQRALKRISGVGGV